MLNYLTPTPGSNFFALLKQKNRITEDRWERYNGEFVCFKPQNMTKNDLIVGRTKLLNEIYEYDKLYKRLTGLWSDGVFVRDDRRKKSLLTRGRMLFSLDALFRINAERQFILKSLWKKNITSVGTVSLAVNFHNYAKNEPT